MSRVAIDIRNLSHRYAPQRRHDTSRTALDALSLQVQEGEIFGLLGPNGSGKSTLFRILATLLKPTSGSVSVFDHNLDEDPSSIRALLGVVFQSPSLDKKLKVRENLLHQGHLYGLRGEKLRTKTDAMLSRLGVLDRKEDLVEHLSGGMQRRVELAKGLLHEPKLLLLDEPSTGLDPAARLEFDNFLQSLRAESKLTILLTTHILDEAEICDRIVIMDQGNIVALGTPHELKQEIGGDVISVIAQEPDSVCNLMRERFKCDALVIDGTIRLERTNGHQFLPQLIEAFPRQIESISVSKPTLEDVFIHKTGHGLFGESVGDID